MNRRGFIKRFLGVAVAAALPACKFPAGPTEHVGIDLAKTGSDKTVFFVSTPDGSWGWSQETGGYMYSDELSEALRKEIQPMIKFRDHKNRLVTV